MTDPDRTRIAADLLEENGFEEEADLLRGKGELVQLAHEILKVCKAELGCERDLIHAADLIQAGIAVPALEIILARNEKTLAAMMSVQVEELAAELIKAFLERFGQRPADADKFLTPHEWRQRLAERRNEELRKAVEDNVDEMLAERERPNGG